MKHRIVLLFILLAVRISLAQPPQVLWSLSLGDQITGAQEAWGVASALDGGTWVVGFQQTNGQLPNALVYKLNLMGTVLDTFRLADSDGHALYAAAPTSDGGRIAAGKTASNDGTTSELLLLKLNSSGNADWVHSYTDDQTRIGNSVQQTADGGYIAAGRARGANGSLCAFLLKTNSAGTMQWSHNYGTTSNDQANAVRQTRDGGFIFTGVSDTLTMGSNAVLTIRTNATGGVIWRHIYRPGDYDEGHAIQQLPDGGFAVAGWSRVAGTYNNDALLLKLDSTGTMQWTHHYGTSVVDIGWDMGQAQDGGFVIAGYSRTAAQSNAMILKTSSTGDSVWARSFVGSRDSEFKAIMLSGDGGIVAAGYRYLNGSTSDYYVVRLAVPSGVGGIIRDEHGQPVQGARVAAMGQPFWAESGTSGHYVLSLVGGTYDLMSYGPCTGRDTIRNITVIQDSIISQDWSVGRTFGICEQTSLNPVVHNHIPTPDTLHLRNSGAGVVDYSVVCHTIQPQGAWLSAEPASGSIPSDSMFDVLIWIGADTNNAGIYDYNGLLDVHMNSCPDSLWQVPVVATVLDAPSNLSPYPLAFSLSASPNPFNPATEIHFDLPREENVSLLIYDITGREVAS